MNTPENQTHQRPKRSATAACSICVDCGDSISDKMIEKTPQNKSCATCTLLKLNSVIFEDEQATKDLKIRRIMYKVKSIKSGESSITRQGEIVNSQQNPDAFKY